VPKHIKLLRQPVSFRYSTGYRDTEDFFTAACYRVVSGSVIEITDVLGSLTKSTQNTVYISNKLFAFIYSPATIAATFILKQFFFILNV